MANPLLTKLQHAVHLSAAEKDVLLSLTARDRRVGPDYDLLQIGDQPSMVLVVLEDMACRYRTLLNAQRSITSLLVPGDLCNLPVVASDRLDHCVATLTACRIAEVPYRAITDLMARSVSISQALWWVIMVDASVQREWYVSICRRSAAVRTAHLVCELLARLQAVGLADPNSFRLPLTQSELGDILGLSSVHINRTLKALRSKQLIAFEQGRLTIPDVERLKTYAQFTPEYLHLYKGPHR